MLPSFLLQEQDIPNEDETDTGKRFKRMRESAAQLKKAPQAPKRFKSSYICFFMAKRPEIKQQLGAQASMTEISKRSAVMWYVWHLLSRCKIQSSVCQSMLSHSLFVHF